MASNEEIRDIEDETKLIFEHYVENCLEQDRNNNVIDPGTPGLAIEELPKVDNEKCVLIGKELVKIAISLNIDNFNDQDILRKVINMINIHGGSQGAFEEFLGIAEEVFRNQVSWNSIVYLFHFGYLIARDRLVQGASSFLQHLFQWIIDIFKRFSVFNWIIRQGGWSSLIRDTVRNYNPLVIAGGVAAVAALCVLFYLKTRKNP